MSNPLSAITTNTPAEAAPAEVIATTSTAPKETSVEVTPQDAKLAETFQRITKQETHLKNERAKIEEARKAFEADKAKAEKYSQLEGKDPFEILEHFGITYEKLLEADKNKRTPIDPNVKKALERVQELESKIVSKEEQMEAERRSRAELQIKADIQKTIKEHDFDVIEILGAEQAVIDYMEEMYNQTNEIIEYKDACQAITDSLVEQYNKVGKSRFLSKLKSEPEVSETAETKPKSQSITHKMAQSTLPRPAKLSETQRMAEALAILNRGT